MVTLEACETVAAGSVGAAVVLAAVLLAGNTADGGGTGTVADSLGRAFGRLTCPALTASGPLAFMVTAELAVGRESRAARAAVVPMKAITTPIMPAAIQIAARLRPILGLSRNITESSAGQDVHRT